MYWVSCKQACQIGAQRRAADIVERRDERALRGRLDHRLERGEHALAVALAERDEAHAGRNEIGRTACRIGVQRRLERDAVARGGDADRDRIGHWPSPGRGQPVERGARPGRAGRLDEGCALRRGLQMALLRRREGRGKLGDRAQRRVVGVGQ